ncbi:hypothetical protein Ataiwa_37640 [Algoriphagus taiwanensis]|uniref:Secretin/TonB short N-terminal domain-containing protein n=1 Tax=Algoriphagus taiwanensis TaxID=1445656 RepID=A0ABQ6Q6K7_9BACT|nr:hypothetical protein Ataiwa_37640 [Algoriphagus taiwanensis]
MKAVNNPWVQRPVRLILLLGGLIFCLNVQAQEIPLLEKKLSISFERESVESVLKKVEQEAGCRFSYSPSVLDVKQNFSGKFEDRPLREILETVFKGEVQFKTKGNYVILTPRPQEKKEIVISGYVVDEGGQGIRDATIYDPITLKSSTTDQFGYFELEVKNPAEENFQLIVNKKDFSDTLLLEKKSAFQKIRLKAEEIDWQKLGKSVSESAKEVWFWTKSSKGVRNSQNLDSTLSRTIQFTLVPFVGSNRKISGAVVNDFSFNLIGGYSGGTRIAELGGIFNIDRGDVSWVQLAGLYNQVGGQTRGLQLAGLVNMTLDSVKAFQGAGLINFTTESLQGVQMASFINYTHRDVRGVQVSAFLNWGRNVSGFQLGLVNLADSLSGVSFGLLNIVRNGYRTLEFGANEMLPLNLSFRSGTRRFYNFFQAGFRPESLDSPTWSFGYGIGTAPRLGKKTFLNIELSADQVSNGSIEALNLVSKAYLGFEYQMANNFALFVGPTLNWRRYDTSFFGHPELFSYSDPNIFFESENLDRRLGSQLWMGFRAGFRFF